MILPLYITHITYDITCSLACSGNTMRSSRLSGPYILVILSSLVELRRWPCTSTFCLPLTVILLRKLGLLAGLSMVCDSSVLLSAASGTVISETLLLVCGCVVMDTAAVVEVWFVPRL